jgi:hypothetical protein
LAFFGWPAFIGGTALLVLLADPPGVVVAIIAALVIGVLLTAVLFPSAQARSRRPVPPECPPLWLSPAADAAPLS